MREKMTLSIEGMYWEPASAGSPLRFKGVKGVEMRSVEVGSAQMAFDPHQTSADEIAATVNRIGFAAHVGQS